MTEIQDVSERGYINDSASEKLKDPKQVITLLPNHLFNANHPKRQERSDTRQLGKVPCDSKTSYEGGTLASILAGDGIDG